MSRVSFLCPCAKQNKLCLTGKKLIYGTKSHSAFFLERPCYISFVYQWHFNKHKTQSLASWQQKYRVILRCQNFYFYSITSNILYINFCHGGIPTEQRIILCSLQLQHGEICRAHCHRILTNADMNKPHLFR